jgi:hypothetical protein
MTIYHETLFHGLRAPGTQIFRDPLEHDLGTIPIGTGCFHDVEQVQQYPPIITRDRGVILDTDEDILR